MERQSTSAMGLIAVQLLAITGLSLFYLSLFGVVP